MQSPPFSRRVSRRSLLVGAGAAAVLAACGGDGDGEQSTTVDPGPALADDTLWLQAGFADGLRLPSTLVAGRRERAPFVFFGGDGLPAVNGVPDGVEMTVTGPEGATEIIEVLRRDAGIPTPHYPLVFTPQTAGTHTIDVEVSGENQRVEFVVAEPDTVGLVAPGDPMRRVETPTVDDARGYDPICTRFDPCPYHEISLPEALDSGRPTALMISTPGFCQTAICGPVLELLIELDPDMNVIHGEVYTEPGRLGEVADFTELIGPIVSTFEMTFEPSFVVADADGIVRARLDYAFDRDEMSEALATVL